MVINYSTKVWETGTSRVITVRKEDLESECINTGDMVRVTIEKVNGDCRQRAGVEQ